MKPDTKKSGHLKSPLQDRAERMVAAARSGDTDAARDVLRGFIGDVTSRKRKEDLTSTEPKTWSGPIHWEYASYLAECFASILESLEEYEKNKGKRSTRKRPPKRPDIEKLLGLKTSDRGRRQGDRRVDHEQIAAFYHYRVRQGCSEPNAKKEAQHRFQVDRKVVADAIVENGYQAFGHKLVPLERLQQIFEGKGE